MNTQANTTNRQLGLTLVELLVAMVISSVLLAGIMRIFLGSKQSYLLQDSLARLQENGRFAMQMLDRDLRMVGHPMNYYFIRPTENVFTGRGSLPNLPTEGGGTTPDELTLQYLPVAESAPGVPGTARNCVGAVITFSTPSSFVSNRYFIDDEGLQCESLDQGGGGTTTALLIPNAVNLQLTYGIDVELGGLPLDGAPNLYKTANNIADVAEWKRVVAVRAQVTLEASDFDDNAATTTQRVFSTTVPIRNQSR